MEITFKGTQYDLPEKVTERASVKLRSLKKYIGKHSDTAHAYVELGKETTAHQSGEIWCATVRLSFNGKSFTASALEESIENAIDRVAGEMATELKRDRERERNLVIKGGQAVKNLMRGMRI